MTKTFTIFTLSFFLALGAKAQKNTLNIPVAGFSEYQIESVTADAQLDAHNTSNETNSSLSTISRGGGALWSEDFGNGFPSGWATDDASGLCPWKWSTNGSYGFFETNATSYGDPINSTTAGNGFLMCDLDSANHFNFGQPSGTTYQYIETYFATTEIDLGASYSSLLLQFEQAFRFNNSVDLIVEVSPDSTTWTQYTVQGSAQNNDASDNPDLVSLNISGAIGASQTVFLRIGWNARVYYWMIDDMQIVEGDSYDLTVEDVWHGDIFQAFEYEQIPLSQAQEVVIGGASINNGGLTQTGVSYEYDITLDGTSVADGSFAANNADIGSSGRDTTWHSTGFTPSETGDYEVSITVSGDSAEPNLSNNTFSSDFEVTEFIYAHDEEDDITLQISGGDDASGEPNEYKMGLLYEAVADGQLTSIETAFGGNTTATSCFVEVYNTSANPNLDDPVYTDVFDFDQSQVSSGAIQIVTIPIDGGDGVEFITGDLYMVVVGTASSGDELWILASDVNDDQAQLRYGPFGAGGAIDWYTGYTTSPILRANFDPTVSIKEVPAEDVFQMFPNPAIDIVQLNFKSTDVREIVLTDATGKLVDVYPVVSGSINHQMDVSNLTGGVYFLSVMTESAFVTQKLIVQ